MSEWKQVAPGVKTRQVKHITQPGDKVVPKPKKKEAPPAKEVEMKGEASVKKKTPGKRSSDG